MTRSAMSGSGPRIVTTTATARLPQMGERTRLPQGTSTQATVRASAYVLIEDHRGCSRRGRCARPPAKEIPPTIGTGSWDSAWRGRCQIWTGHNWGSQSVHGVGFPSSGTQLAIEGSIALLYGLNLSKGASKNVTIRYKDYKAKA